jgi:hypothetical protein
MAFVLFSSQLYEKNYVVWFQLFHMCWKTHSSLSIQLVMAKNYLVNHQELGHLRYCYGCPAYHNDIESGRTV